MLLRVRITSTIIGKTIKKAPVRNENIKGPKEITSESLLISAFIIRVLAFVSGKSL